MASWDVTLTQVQFGTLIVMRATATPADPPWWQWYINGQPAGLTPSNQIGATAETGVPLEVLALPLATPDIDPWDYVPQTGDGRYTLEWAAADGDAAVAYRVDYAIGAPSGWAALATVELAGGFRYAYTTPRFDSGQSLYLRVAPVTDAGDDGPVLEVGPLATGGRPNAPDVSVSYAGGTQRITIS